MKDLLGLGNHALLGSLRLGMGGSALLAANLRLGLDRGSQSVDPGLETFQIADGIGLFDRRRQPCCRALRLGWCHGTRGHSRLEQLDLCLQRREPTDEELHRLGGAGIRHLSDGPLTRGCADVDGPVIVDSAEGLRTCILTHGANFAR